MASEGLRLVGATNDELAQAPKADDRKQVESWGLRRPFTVPCKWVASRLQMGDPTRVSAAVRQVQGSVAKLRQRRGECLIRLPGLPRMALS